MSERIGTVIVFKEGVTEGEAAEILMSIQDKIEIHCFPKTTNTYRAAREMVRTFDDEYGGPVWYIP